MATGAPTPPLTPSYTSGEAETIAVDSRTVACDGGNGPLGHPRVWLHIEGEQIFCPYCSRIYRLNPGAGADHGH